LPGLFRYSYIVLNIDPQLAASIEQSVRTALAEDIGAGDLTAALVPAQQRARARVIVRHNAIICGQPWFNQVFAQLDPTIVIEWLVEEGAPVNAGDKLCELSGLARPLLTGERTALNFLQTLSATATAAQAYQAAVARSNATILDTRKTLPGLRLAQKYAVSMSGAQNHRIGLYDGILIKENHIAACGGIAAAVTAANEQRAARLVEVEVETLAEVHEAIEAGAKRLLLDNFSLEDMKAAVRLRDNTNLQVGLEASGGVDLDTVKAIAATGVDFISVGAITKDIKAVDLSMRFEMLD
jgi:nicotinate-nucleotide pyrophosphorylase (carboxylating)